MASRKGRRDNQHDKSRDDKDVTTITNVPHRSEELRMMVQNLQWNWAKQQYIENEEHGNNQHESLRQEAISPVIRWETLYNRFNRLEPREFKGLMDPHEAEDWLHSTQIILEVMKLSDRENITARRHVLRKETMSSSLV